MRRAPSRLKHTRLLTLCPLQRLKAAVLVSAWMNSCPTQNRAELARLDRRGRPSLHKLYEQPLVLPQLMHL